MRTFKWLITSALLVSALFAGSVLAATPATSKAAPAAPANPVVVMDTNFGMVVIELEPAKAPKTVNHFLGLVNRGEYNNSMFHRVIAGFIVQGGGFDADAKQLSEPGFIDNESANGLSNTPGTIAMARRSHPDSASRQFFFNVSNNSSSLDARGDRLGYTVFGRVTSGMDVIEQIARQPTQHDHRLHYDDVPVSPVIINKAYRLSR
jgi:peptidyl-prolyl cis-trans isomerase A (cyclophilin A)